MLRQIEQLTSDQAKLQAQVSTGRRVTEPEDDPAAVGRILILQAQQRQNDQYASNANRAATLANTTFSGLQGIKRISDRIGELSTLGTGAMDTTAMQSYGTETDQLLEQALQLANSQSGNDYIYGGTAVSSPPFVAVRDVNGKITSITYQGNTSQAPISLSATASVAPTTTGATNNGIAAFLNNLVTLRDALNSGSTSAVQATQTSLQTGEDTIIDAMAQIGGVQTRIEAAQSQQKDQQTNLASLISSESSVDLPTTVVKLSQTQTAYQAALASASKIMNMSLLDYIR